MINVKASGARTRISTFLAGVFLLILVAGLGDTVGDIPMAALVAVTIMVSVGTLDWHSIHPKTLRRMPRSETLVMLSTVVVVVITHDLAIGVIAGVIVAMILFARRVAHFTTVNEVAHPDDDTKIYAVTGELFFASSNDLVYRLPHLGRLHRRHPGRDHHQVRFPDQALVEPGLVPCDEWPTKAGGKRNWVENCSVGAVGGQISVSR